MNMNAFKLLAQTPFHGVCFKLSRCILKTKQTHTNLAACTKSTMVMENPKMDPDKGNEDYEEPESFADARPLSAMPGPGGLKSIPYIGTMFLFHPFTKYTLETYGRLACDMHTRYGPVFKIRLGKNYAVHTCRVEDIEKVFSLEPKYPRRRLMGLSRVYRERNGLPQGLGSCGGSEWHQLRKPLNVVLKRPKAVLSYLPSLNKVADDFTQRLVEMDGGQEHENVQEMYNLFFKYSSESIGVVCFNERLGFLSNDFDNHPEKKKLLESFRTSLECTFRDIMGMERRYLKSDQDEFYLSYQKAMSYVREQSMVYVKKVVPSVSGDLTSGHLHLDGAAAADDDDSNVLKNLIRRKDLNMEQICAIIDSLLIAGTDSSARILTVLLYDIAQNPDIQERIAQEVRQLVGADGPITKDAVDQLRLSKACVKESMRVHYPVSSGLERILTHDMVIGGYHIKEGTSVFMTGAKTSHDPKYFPNPTAFVPDRWLREHRSSTATPEVCEGSHVMSAKDSRLAAFAFIPFGHGARSCIGSRFADMELLIGLVKVVQKLRVSVHPSYKGLNVKYTPFITPLKPIPFVFTKR